jgi:hypothetical protein
VTSPAVRPLRAVPAAVPLSELGNVGQTSMWQLLAEEPTPELQWPQSVAVYDRMYRQDGQALSVYDAITLPIRRAKWRLNPNGARDELVQQLSEDLSIPIKGTDDAPARVRTRDRFSWAQHLEWALLELVYGHMAFEQVARLDDHGRVRLRKLAPRWPKTITGFDVAEDGGLVGIEQQAPLGRITGNSSTVKIPVERLVMYTHRRQGGTWTGQSIFRPMYKHWLLKDQALMGWTNTLDRNGMGVPIYEGGPLETDLTSGERMATNARAGRYAGGAIPNGASFGFEGVTGQLPDHERNIRYHDESMARSGLAHFLNLGQSAGTGSWALGTTFADFFIMSLDSLAQSVADVATQHVVEDLVDWNAGIDERAPLIEVETVGKGGTVIANAVKALIDSGAIRNDPTLEAYLRDLLGLPIKAPRTAADPIPENS